MGKHYEQLSYRERLTIADGVRKRLSVRAIARTLKRSPSTISRELERNCEYFPYDGWAALARALRLRRQRRLSAPDQIAAAWRRANRDRKSVV